MKEQIVLIDAGTGNLNSVEHALITLGAQVKRTADPQVVLAADKIIMPGVGAFGKFMQNLQALNLDDAVKQAVHKGALLLGICVGMQALLQTGEELGSFDGLGLLPGKVIRFADKPGWKIPHTGWNQIMPLKQSWLFNLIDAGSYVYFNHSFYCATDDACIAAKTDYVTTFASVIIKENIYGVQFHPEKSQKVGLKLLQNFMEAKA